MIAICFVKSKEYCNKKSDIYSELLIKVGSSFKKKVGSGTSLELLGWRIWPA